MKLLLFRTCDGNVSNILYVVKWLSVVRYRIVFIWCWYSNKLTNWVNKAIWHTFTFLFSYFYFLHYFYEIVSIVHPSKSYAFDSVSANVQQISTEKEKACSVEMNEVPSIIYRRNGSRGEEKPEDLTNQTQEPLLQNGSVPTVHSGPRSSHHSLHNIG